MHATLRQGYMLPFYLTALYEKCTESNVLMEIKNKTLQRVQKNCLTSNGRNKVDAVPEEMMRT